MYQLCTTTPCIRSHSTTLISFVPLHCSDCCQCKEYATYPLFLLYLFCLDLLSDFHLYQIFVILDMLCPFVVQQVSTVIISIIVIQWSDKKQNYDFDYNSQIGHGADFCLFFTKDSKEFSHSKQ